MPHIGYSHVPLSHRQSYWPFKSWASAYITQFADKLEVQQILIHNDPGPFELKDGFMKNPCLRSCLQWCTSELRLEPYVSGSWELVKTNRKNDAFATELTAIYCCLWERPQSRETEHKSTTCVLWIDQTERLMGISAEVLLRTVCSMIISASSPGKANPRDTSFVGHI